MSAKVGTKPSELVLHLREIDFLGLTFVSRLLSGETLSANPAVTVTNPASGLAVSEVQINSVQFNDPDSRVDPIPANKGVIAKFDPSAVGEYTVVVEADTSAGRHLARQATVIVRGS